MTMRLIDADKMRNDDSMCEGVLCDECPFADRLRSKCSFVDFMDRQPTIDAVQVVRCKECKHSVYDELFHTRWCGGEEVQDDDFCSYGCREDGEDE